MELGALGGRVYAFARVGICRFCVEHEVDLFEWTGIHAHAHAHAHAQVHYSVWSMKWSSSNGQAYMHMHMHMHKCITLCGA